MAATRCDVCSAPLRTGYRVRGSPPRCLHHALLHPALLRRSLLTALVVGTVLMTINHADQILTGAVTWVVLLKIGLTYCVPFCVASYGALGASRVAISVSAPAAPTESSTSVAASGSSGLNVHSTSPPR